MASRLHLRFHLRPGILPWTFRVGNSRGAPTGICPGTGCALSFKRLGSTASGKTNPSMSCVPIQCSPTVTKLSHTGNTSTSEWPHPIHASSRITDRKSVFLAHASTLPNTTSFPPFLAYLTSLSTLKRATHCMYAYRTSDPITSQPVLGQNDGGESGSGDRLARLLELAGCENTVVVVSRWYGGVQLGSDRWRLISSVANEALDQGGFKKPKQQTDDTKRKSSSKKRK